MSETADSHEDQRGRAFRQGYYGASGAFCYLCLLIVIASVIIWGADRLGWLSHDNTDPHRGHSGFSLYTDALTGCQYLGASSGLTPRMGQDGRQICGVRP